MSRNSGTSIDRYLLCVSVLDILYTHVHTCTGFPLLPPYCVLAATLRGEPGVLILPL